MRESIEQSISHVFGVFAANPKATLQGGYAGAEIGRNPVSKHQLQPDRVWRMSRLTRDGTAEPITRDQVLKRERGQGNINFPYSADH